MKVGSTAPSLVQPLLKLLESKTLSTLLQLSKPLSPTQVLVTLASNETITLNIKTPLEKDALYHASIQKKGDDFIAKELFKLPVQLKQLLKAPALLTLETLIRKLSLGEDPKKVIIDTLSQQILSATDKEQASQLLDHLSQQLLLDTQTLVYEHRGLKGYVRFKTNKREFSQKVLIFEAYFPLLGALKGRVSFINGIKSAQIEVMSQESKILLENAQDSLPMKLTVTLDKDLSIDVPVQKLLDIKG